MDLIVGRQAILDHRQRTVAYELLYRPVAGGIVLDADTASASVLIDGVLGIGLEQLTEGRPAFVNVPECLLLSGHLSEFDFTDLILEILECTRDTPEVRQALRGLRNRGYRLALDDVVADDPRLGLLPFVDVAKIDVVGTTPRQRAELVAACRSLGVSVLYEKVEEPEQADEAASLQVDLLQGYFFARPQVVRSRDVRVMDAQRARLLVEVSRTEPNLAVVEQLIRGDLYLAERFLRLVNAAAFGWRQRIESIGHALVLLGQQPVRRWLSLVVLAAAASGKPTELVVLGASRARFLEEMAGHAGLEGRRLDLFAGGMFSIMDAALDRPLEEAIASLPLADDVRAGMLGTDNTVGRLLELARAFEQADWRAISQRAATLGVTLRTAGNAYAEAMRWSTPAVSA